MDIEPPNPLLEDWSGAFGVPPFDGIKPEHFRPAFDRAIAEHESEIESIAAGAEEPSFDNTIAALERSGRVLGRVSDVFHALAARIPTRLAGDRARNVAAARRASQPALLNEKCSVGWRSCSLAATAWTFAEQARVLERYHIAFRRAGAHLEAQTKEAVQQISECWPRSAPPSARTS